MENKEIICNDENIQQKFNLKIHKPTDTFTLKLKLNANSLQFNNNITNVSDFVEQQTNLTKYIKIII